MKRSREDEDTGPPTSTKKARAHDKILASEAAKFNQMVLRKLQRAFETDPEDDLLSKFPSGYSTRLAGRKEQDESE